MYAFNDSQTSGNWLQDFACVCLSSVRGSFLCVSGGNPDREYIKTTSGALAETGFDPEDKGRFFFPPQMIFITNNAIQVINKQIGFKDSYSIFYRNILCDCFSFHLSTRTVNEL